MRLVAGFSPRRPGFDLGPVHVMFVVAKLAMGQGFLRVLRCYPVSIIPPMLRTHFHLQAALTRKTDEAWEPSKKQCSLGNRVSLGRKGL
jgi:hypothetical protein